MQNYGDGQWIEQSTAPTNVDWIGVASDFSGKYLAAARRSGGEIYTSQVRSDKRTAVVNVIASD
jgi:hypothetical protein